MLLNVVIHLHQQTGLAVFDAAFIGNGGAQILKDGEQAFLQLFLGAGEEEQVIDDIIIERIPQCTVLKAGDGTLGKERVKQLVESLLGDGSRAQQIKECFAFPAQQIHSALYQEGGHPADDVEQRLMPFSGKRQRIFYFFQMQQGGRSKQDVMADTLAELPNAVVDRGQIDAAAAGDHGDHGKIPAQVLVKYLPETVCPEQLVIGKREKYKAAVIVGIPDHPPFLIKGGMNIQQLFQMPERVLFLELRAGVLCSVGKLSEIKEQNTVLGR